jgi:hypothetical protein
MKLSRRRRVTLLNKNMNFLLTLIASVVVAICAGAVVHALNMYSGIGYVVLLLLDLSLFSFFCRKNRIVLVRPFIYFIGINLIIAIYFLGRS